MIVRVVTARVKPGRASHFNALIRQQLPKMHEQPGLVYVKLARRLDPDGSEEVVLFEEWRDPPSVYAWAGPTLMRARLPEGAEEELLDVHVMHYEALDVDEHGIPATLRAAGLSDAARVWDDTSGGPGAAGDRSADPDAADPVAAEPVADAGPET